MSQASDVRLFHESFVGVVRALGLLRPDTTPCGQSMTITEAHTISELHAAGPVTQQVLAQRLRLQKSTVSRLVDQLEASGVVRRAPNPSDGRSVLVELTASGRRRAARLVDAQMELSARLLDGIPRAERRGVLDALRSLEAASRVLR